MPMTPQQYADRLQARYERMVNSANRKQAEAEALHGQSHQMASIIPSGQPILIGHHSEGRDRNYRARIEAKARRAIALQEQAEELANRAEALLNNSAISSDDPEAADKITARIESFKARHERMVKANRLVRLNDRPGLLGLGFTEAEADDLLKGDFIGRKGFPPYALQNSSANIRRLEDRLKQIERAASTKPAQESIGPVTIITNPDMNRTQIEFPGKPSDACRAELKRYGFKWAPTIGMWQRHMSDAALYMARQVVTKFYGGEQ